MAGNKNTGAFLVPKNEGTSLVSMFLSKFHISPGLSFRIGRLMPSQRPFRPTQVLTFLVAALGLILPSLSLASFM